MANTIQQDAIHTAFQRPESLLVIAGAGTGKTTTVVNGQHLLPRETLFLAFNKAIADELAIRMPARKDNCKTFHAIGLRIISSRLGRMPTDAYKYSRIATEQGLNRQDSNRVKDIIEQFQLAVEGASTHSDDWDLDFFMKTCGEDIYLLDEDGCNLTLEDTCEFAMSILRVETRQPTAFSFSDMIWMCVYFAIHRKWFLVDYKVVVIDEAQDVSPIRLEMLRRLTKRVIAIGDPRQSIYAFAGAMLGAMGEIQQAFNAQELPLSVTWRCDNAIIKEAETVVGPYLMPRPNAGEGEVKYLSLNSMENTMITNTSMVVCRTNAPLLGLALKLLRARKPFRLMSDYPDKLSKRAEKLAKGLNGMAAFRTAVRDFYEAKVESVKSKGLIARLRDEQECMLEVSNQCDNPSDVGELFRSLMLSKNGPILCTGHKSKGLEAEHVFFLRPDLSPAPWVDPENAGAYQQELNLRYVMITRAKHTLTYLEQPDGAA